MQNPVGARGLLGTLGINREMGNAMKATTCVPLAMRIPPPLLFVATFFAGLGLQRLAPLTVHSSSVGEASDLVGIGLLICGVLLALASVGMFLVARTTLIPFGTASKLITRGPYRFTRNPMYLSLTLVYLGAVGMLLHHGRCSCCHCR